MIHFFHEIFFVAFPQKCHYQSETHHCTFGITCWMSGHRPLDLCNGGIFWSCCVPFETIAQNTTSVIPEEVSDPGLFQSYSRS